MKKVILVTGASSGIGKATAKRLLSDGHTVYVAARRIDKMKSLVSRGAIAIQMDITVESDIKKVLSTIHANHHVIDVLVNNAGYAVYGPVEDVPIDEARRQFEVNLFGMARLTQLVLPQMRNVGSGTIINMSSIGGKVYTPLGAWYHATKHAVEGWSDCLRLELAPFNIDVVIIEPGLISTEFSNTMLDNMTQQRKDSPYKSLTDKVVQATARIYRPSFSSPASVIANLISQAVSARHPKIRYSAGRFAKPMMAARKYLGDRIFDRIIMSQIK